MKYFNHQKVNFKYPVITMGTFDGVHKGHKKLLKKLTDTAKEKHGESIVITYYHHPLEIIHKKTFPYLLTERDIKEHCLKNQGVDYVLYLKFDKKMAEMSAYEFLKEILIGEVGAKEIVVGYDTHFGRKREGNLDFLKKHQNEFGYKLHYVEPFKIDNIIVSSSKIRDFIREGDLEKATLYLGREYSLKGKVIHGEKIGTEIGFPTVNLKPIDEYKLIPALGVYATSLLIDNKRFYGVTNVGYSPTLKNTHIKEIETYIFDFSDDIYDKNVELFFHKRIRDEKFFSRLEDLIKEIENDIKFTKKYFNI